MRAATIRQDSPGLLGDIQCIHAFKADRILISASDLADGEGLARQIHWGTAPIAGRFTSVDCGASTEELEHDVFAWLTDRGSRSPGTLFLKEVGRLTLHQQVRLLTALTDCSLVEPPDATSRVIALTSEPLFERVETGSFDATLFYRLNVIHLDLRQ